MKTMQNSCVWKKKKRIEELEALVEEAVGEDDFEKAETLQNEIDEIKASL